MMNFNRKSQFKTARFADTRKRNTLPRTFTKFRPSFNKSHNSIAKFISSQLVKNEEYIKNGHKVCRTNEQPANVGGDSRKRTFQQIAQSIKNKSYSDDRTPDKTPISKFVSISFDKVICKITSSTRDKKKQKKNKIGRKSPEIARCSIVDSNGAIVLDTYIKPQHPIINYKTMTTGITEENIKVGQPVEEVKKLLQDILKDKYIVGRKLESNLKQLGLDEILLKDSQNVRDLSRNYFIANTYKRKFAGRLKGNQLNAALHGRSSENDDMNSLDYSKAMMEFYHLVHDDWEDMLLRNYNQKKSNRRNKNNDRSGEPLFKRNRKEAPADYSPHNLPTEHTAIHIEHCENDNEENIDSAIPPLSKLVAVDCEMVGVRGVGLNKKGSPRQDLVLGRCSIVDADGGILLDIFVKPEKPILDYHTKYSGIREFHMNIAEPHQQAIQIISQTLKDKILVGHSIQGDLKVIEQDLNRLMNEGRIRDTSECKILNKLYHEKVGLCEGKISLKKFTQSLRGRSIQSAEHCSVEDAKATMELYRLVRDEWEQAILKTQQRKEKACYTVKHRNVTTRIEIQTSEKETLEKTEKNDKLKRKTAETIKRLKGVNAGKS